MKRRQSQVSFSLFAFQDIITAVTGVLILLVMILALALIRSTTVRSEYDGESVNLVREQVHSLEGLVAAAQQKISTRKTLIDRQIVSPEDLAIAVEAGKQSNSALEHEIGQLKQSVEMLANTNDDDVERLINEKERNLANRKEAARQTAEEFRSELNHLEEQLAELRTSNQFFFNPPEGFAKQPWLVEVSTNRIRVAPADQSVKPKVFNTIDPFLQDLSTYDSSRQYFVFFVHPSGIGNYDRIVASRELASFDFGVDVLDRSATVISEN